MSKNITIKVFKQTRSGAIKFVIERDEKEIFSGIKIEHVATAIKNSGSLRKEGENILIDCAPDVEIVLPYGKNPIHNEALSEEEEKLLFKELHAGG